MKRLIIMIIVLLSIAGCTQKEEDPRPLVLTSIYPVYDITLRIASEAVNVQNIAPLSMEVHDYEPSPQDILQMESASLLIVHGAHLEGWLESTLGNLQNKDLKILILSDHIELLDGDVHSWLSIDTMILYSQLIEAALSEMDAANTKLYKSEQAAWEAEAYALISQYPHLYHREKHQDIVVDHMAFAYLVNDINMTQVSLTQGLLANDISAHGLKTIIDKIRQDKIEVIYKDESSNDNLFRLIQTETNVNVEQLSTLEVMSTTSYQTYLEMMSKNFKALERSVTYD